MKFHICARTTFNYLCTQFHHHSVTTCGAWLSNAKPLKYPSQFLEKFYNNFKIKKILKIFHKKFFSEKKSEHVIMFRAAYRICNFNYRMTSSQYGTRMCHIHARIRIAVHAWAHGLANQGSERSLAIKSKVADISRNFDELQQKLSLKIL